MPTPSKLTVNFSGVEDRREGGKAAHVPEGDYLLKVVGVELAAKKGDEASKYLKWRFTIVKPERYKNAGVVYHNTTLKPEGLWSLRNVLEDLGITVPKSSVALPLQAIAKSGRIMGATLADGEPYNNKVKSEIAASFKKEAYEETSAPAEEETTDEEVETEDEEEATEELDLEDI